MSSSRAMILIACLFLLSVLAWGLRGSRPRESAREQVRSAGASTTPPAAPATAAPFGAGAPQKADEAIDERHRERWNEFRARYGSGLEARFGREGYLDSLRGSPGSGAAALPGFDPADADLSVRRAREIVEAARALLGTQPGFPLEAPSANPGGISSQVTFRESHDGVPLEPLGKVTVDLGPQGEILGLWSSYLRDVRLANSPRLEPEAARARAQGAVLDPERGLPTEGGRLVIWTTRASGQAPVGRYAYEFTVQGRQVIIDASTGEVLSRRDRRER